MFTQSLKKHCNLEFSASRMYLAVSIAASQAGWFGLSKWCVGEAQDEITHGNRILSLIRDVYGEEMNIKDKAMNTPDTEDLKELLQILLDGEIEVANSITKLLNEVDCLAINDLLYLSSVQRDSILKLRDLVKQADSASGDISALQAIDKSLEIYYVIGCPES